ncbi:COMM domain-containing protein 2-like [Dysidea avara]|uniref:COMM domain-containing protein 2-like n=1 Tax=Dysidea avara TaxID=196820 RepID=UPI0033169056
MLLVLSDEHREHLKFLTQVDSKVVNEFCKLSLDFIQRGVNRKVYQSAAQKLGVDVDTIQHGVEGLMYLLTECSKLMLSELDFHDSIMTLGFSEEINKVLLQIYLDNRKEVRNIVSQLTIGLPNYHNLEWRFDIQLASRSLHRQTEPQVLLKLHTIQNGESKYQLMQTDPVNLLHLTRTLEAALNEVKSQHCRRIMRNIK